MSLFIRYHVDSIYLWTEFFSVVWSKQSDFYKCIFHHFSMIQVHQPNNFVQKFSESHFLHFFLWMKMVLNQINCLEQLEQITYYKTTVILTEIHRPVILRDLSNVHFRFRYIGLLMLPSNYIQAPVWAQEYNKPRKHRIMNVGVS